MNFVVHSPLTEFVSLIRGISMQHFRIYQRFGETAQEDSFLKLNY